MLYRQETAARHTRNQNKAAATRGAEAKARKKRLVVKISSSVSEKQKKERRSTGASTRHNYEAKQTQTKWYKNTPRCCSRQGRRNKEKKTKKSWSGKAERHQATWAAGVGVGGWS